ncbi:cytochrome P450 89A2-like protein [Corchorus olitorius]|uniref:Cytochrome P450 89A2-like protein n=1 Tax=Corchorus olitorius TaxID=93759 RepID=A0A1R3H2A6_9ROSI|nr:cytochrome P450 89A2-like protein [Corchorus olitorius]
MKSPPPESPWPPRRRASLPNIGSKLQPQPPLNVLNPMPTSFLPKIPPNPSKLAKTGLKFSLRSGGFHRQMTPKLGCVVHRRVPGFHTVYALTLSICNLVVMEFPLLCPFVNCVLAVEFENDCKQPDYALDLSFCAM